VTKRVYLSLGSNLGDRVQYLDEALSLLQSADFSVVRRSSLYETEPRDFANQPWFLNLVVEAETALFPRRLLTRIKKIERQLGRQRIIEKGPRTIDIDILLFGRFVIETPDLVIPHPRMLERRFVLEPLAEICPDLRHPATGESIRGLLSGVASQKVTKMKYP
jgi:2-amino-4-hydroxy-6-hydroxymethyldihydropteridine diphosphokinase